MRFLQSLQPNPPFKGGILPTLVHPCHTPQNYGFTISARKVAGDYEGWIFLSGQSPEARRFRLIIPLPKGDYIPVWKMEDGAAAVMVLLIPAAGEVWKLQVGSIRETTHLACHKRSLVGFSVGWRGGRCRR